MLIFSIVTSGYLDPWKSTLAIDNQIYRQPTFFSASFAGEILHPNRVSLFMLTDNLIYKIDGVTEDFDGIHSF